MSQVPCEPKMLVSAMNPKALAAFHLTSLEAGGRRELAVEADLGAPLTVLDVSAYAVPAAAQPLHLDDEALLEVNPRSETCMLVGATNISKCGRQKHHLHARIHRATCNCSSESIVFRANPGANPGADGLARYGHCQLLVRKHSLV